MTFTRAITSVLASLVLLAGGYGFLRDRPAFDDSTSAIARAGTLSVVLSESGIVRAATSVTFRSPVEGREVEIIWLAPEGSSVNQGDVLVRLDTTALQTELTRAKEAIAQIEIDLDAARAEREQAAIALRGVTEGTGLLAVEEGRTELLLLQTRAKRLRDEHARLQPLLRKGYITREEFDRAGQEADEAEARASFGEKAFRVLSERTHPANEQAAKLQLAKRDAQIAHLTPRLSAARDFHRSLASLIERCAIRATHPGLVVHEDNLSVTPRRKIRSGDRVTPSQSLVTLPDLRRMTVEATVRESDVRMVTPGQAARVTVDAFPHLQIPGTVARLGTLARSSSEQSGTRFDVAIDLQPHAARILPSMNARVDIVLAEHAAAVIVPAAAIFERDGRRFCFVMKKGAVERRDVSVGRSNQLEVEVSRGIAAGERVSLVDLDPATQSDGRH